MARRYAEVPIGTLLDSLQTMLQAQMPAKVSAAGLPAVVTWTFADVLIDTNADLPQVCVGAKWAHEPKGSGGAFHANYDVEVICAFPWLGTGDGYKDGATMAAIAEALIYANVGLAGYTNIIERAGNGQSVGSARAPMWQGGVWKGRLVGALQNW